MAATRFGGASPAQTYATKVRWLVGCLVVVIALLFGLLVIIGGDKSPEETTVVNQPQAPNNPVVAPGVEILVTSNRIEEGATLNATMFVREQRPPEQIPEGAVRADELNNVVSRYALNLINANTPMLWEYVTEVQPMSALQIPPGYRAVTIYVDARRGIEGWAKPSSRVDVLWTFTDRDGRRKVATIVRYCKILSVMGVTQGHDKVAIQGSKTTITLLVTERDARKVELARTSGTLSLSLVGASEDVRDDQGATEIIDLTSIIDRPRNDPAVPQEVPADGVMYTKDPKTGQHIRFELRKGRWRRAVDG